MSGRRVIRILLTVIVTLLVLAGAAIGFVYSGLYNVAATDTHDALVYWALETTMENSVEARARRAGLVAPDLSKPELVAQGFRNFREMCVPCHGAPGVERGPMGKGLRPAPPDLARAAMEWSPEEVFWIVRHGLKMTGMPAWGPTHDDQELWAIVAFVERLPELSPENYRQLNERFQDRDAGHGHSHDGGTEH